MPTNILLFLMINVSFVALFAFIFLAIDFAAYLKILITKKSDAKNFILSLYKNIRIRDSQVYFDMFQISLMLLGSFVGLMFGIGSLLDLNQNEFSLLPFSILPIIIFVVAIIPLEKISGIATFENKFIFWLTKRVTVPKGIFIFWDKESKFGNFYKLNISLLKYASIFFLIWFSGYLFWMILEFFVF